MNDIWLRRKASTMTDNVQSLNDSVFVLVLFTTIACILQSRLAARVNLSRNVIANQECSFWEINQP